MDASNHVLVEPVIKPEELAQAFRTVSEAFGRQTKDPIWISTNPRWDTSKGQEEGAARYLQRWSSSTLNKGEQQNTVFVTASLLGPDDGYTRRVVGLAIWQQVSFVAGWGDAPNDDLGDVVKFMDAKEARFATQIVSSLHKRRREDAKEKAFTSSPAIFVLDLCAVDPAFQRKGIAGKLVQWGLDEAKRRGGLECTTEASSMGRGVYERFGFKGEGVDIVYEVDEEFEGIEKPPNLFMCTGTDLTRHS